MKTVLSPSSSEIEDWEIGRAFQKDSQADLEISAASDGTITSIHPSGGILGQTMKKH